MIKKNYVSDEGVDKVNKKQKTKRFYTDVKDMNIYK